MTFHRAKRVIAPFDKPRCGLFKSGNDCTTKNNGRECTMKLYDSVGPNPHVVRMFMAEKGIEIPKQPVDLRKGENREAEHLKRNPHGQMPTLELDDGRYLSEITAICEYLEEKNPKPAMIGATAEERAECRMWTRRVDLNICEHLGNGYRFGEGLKFFQSRIPCAPEASPGLKMIAANRLQWLDGQMSNGRKYLCGERFTMADILLYCWLDFAAKVGQPLDPANANIAAWMARVAERPSARA
jgi:glutathione S-transferase